MPDPGEMIETHPQWVAGAIGAGLALFIDAALVLPTLTSPTAMVVSVAVALAGGFGAGALVLRIAPDTSRTSSEPPAADG